MPWMPLDRFDDPSIPKLHNLKRADRAGFEVPPTVWSLARDLESGPPAPPSDFPCIVRSGSPTEDTRTTSNAGQLLSLAVHDPGEFADALRRVVAALPRDESGPLGAVFVQPLIRAEVAGVTFFDGFYYEETSAAGSNAELTQGLARGDVRRDHLRRGRAHDAWLVRLRQTFGGSIDIEWAFPHDGSDRKVPMLLQVRPALFPIRRNETLSLANHKEILGDPPSPWMTGILAEAGQTVLGFFAEVDPEVATWHEPYAVELGERAWLNLSGIFRLLDHWGMPRTMVTESFGGAIDDGPADARPIPRRLARKAVTLARKGLHDLAGIAGIGRCFRRVDAEIDAAKTLADLYRANVRALEIAIRTNFAIGSILSVVSRLRRPLGLAQVARVVTHDMMSEYAELAARPDVSNRLLGLDAWLARFGHRGPLESDPARPRFAEIREALRADLARAPSPPPTPSPRASWLLAAIGRPFFLPDEIRERFRDRLMRRWQVIRARILEEAAKAVDAGHLDAPDDAFMLRDSDLEADPSTWRARVADRKILIDEARRMDLPSTASRDAIEAAIARSRLNDGAPDPAHPDLFRGIGLGSRVVVGTAVRVGELAALLAGGPLPSSPILVAATLEPSWAIVFPRFAAAVVELGGELSHASILLREAGIPAVVNAPGSFRSIADGDTLRVDPVTGTVRIEPMPPSR